MTTTDPFVDLIRDEMMRRRMSARMLGLRAGVHYSAITRLLAGEREPSLRTIRALLGVFGYTLRASCGDKREGV